MGNWIALGVIVLVAALAIVYVIRAKKKGKRCIGCPDGCCASSKKQDDLPCAHCCGCNGEGSCSSDKDD